MHTQTYTDTLLAQPSPPLTGPITKEDSRSVTACKQLLAGKAGVAAQAQRHKHPVRAAAGEALTSTAEATLCGSRSCSSHVSCARSVAGDCWALAQLAQVASGMTCE